MKRKETDTEKPANMHGNFSKKIMRCIYLLIGPAGVGKTTAAKSLEKHYGLRSVEAFTDNVTHLFNNGRNYGDPGAIVDKYDICVTAPAGARYILENYHGEKEIRVVALFADRETLISRMRHRGDTKTEITDRLKKDAEIFKDIGKICDYKIYANNIRQTEKAIYDFIKNQEKMNYISCLEAVTVAAKNGLLRRDEENSDNIYFYLHKNKHHTEGIALTNIFTAAQDLYYDYDGQIVFLTEFDKRNLKIKRGAI